MKVFSTLIWNGEADISLYLDCIKSQAENCKDYFVVCNNLAEGELKKLGIKTMNHTEVMTQQFEVLINQVWQEGKFACGSDILRILTLKKIGEGCHLDGDIYVTSPIDDILSSVPEGGIVIGVENGGWICSGALISRNSEMMKSCAEYLLSRDVLESWWQVYGSMLLARFIPENKEHISFLNPAIFMGVHYEVMRKVGSVDIQKYLSANSLARGLHMFGASVGEISSTSKKDHLTGEVYNSEYYSAEFPDNSPLFSYESKKVKIYKTTSPKCKYSNKVRL